MYKYEWDAEAGGLLLLSDRSSFSKEPRPVYSKELDILGFDQFWRYPKDDSAPLLWAEANNYYYKGRNVARTKGGSLYTKPEIILLDDPEPSGAPMQFVDVPAMCRKNHALMDALVQETIKKIYNTYRRYQDRIDVFYVAFSGGKDSIVVLDLVSRALPHDSFKVLFGDTRMEFPDTYEVIEYAKRLCEQKKIDFYCAQSKLLPSQTWPIFGPPATSVRWCCSVHKTSPQINLLRKITGKNDFTGMAFTGIRAEESISRSEYEVISEGQKHTGQYSCHGILEWGSAELFLYIYEQNLFLNKAYIKGNVRVGCLVCPNSAGKHEYIKRYCYQKEVDSYLDVIAKTSAKTYYSPTEMQNYIDSGFWRTRRSGKALNFGYDLFETNTKSKPPSIKVYKKELNWTEWGKTIGELIPISDDEWSVKYKDKVYRIRTEKDGKSITFLLINCDTSRDDIKFISLFRSVIIKSIYCVGCGACEAECKYGCIHMENGIVIEDNCHHCYKCHEIHGHCLRYNSIKNTIQEGPTMLGKKINGYDGHGPRAEWLEAYTNHCTSGDYEGFWNTDGDGLVHNKKKEMFRDFLKDCGIIQHDKSAQGDKFTKYRPTPFSDLIVKYGAHSETSWSLMLCNLVYTPNFDWYVRNLNFGEVYTPSSIELLLQDAMPNDASGHGKENMINALKIALYKTPLGTSGIFADYDINVKLSSNGEEKLSLISLKRSTWKSPIPEVILYALYKFAEACGEYYQFSLQTLLDDGIERDGVSPTRIFGLSRDTMVRILNGLTINYPEFISASFTLDLDNITLRSDKTADDVLQIL